MIALSQRKSVHALALCPLRGGRAIATAMKKEKVDKRAAATERALRLAAEARREHQSVPKK